MCTFLPFPNPKECMPRFERVLPKEELTKEVERPRERVWNVDEERKAILLPVIGEAYCFVCVSTPIYGVIAANKHNLNTDRTSYKTQTIGDRHYIAVSDKLINAIVGFISDKEGAPLRYHVPNH